MKRIKDKKILQIFILLVGLIGFVLFCPAKLGSGHTCLFEHMTSRSLYCGEGAHNHVDHGYEMARSYIIPYGLLWWASITIVWWSLYERVKKRRMKQP